MSSWIPKGESASAGVKGAVRLYAHASGAEPAGSIAPPDQVVQPLHSAESVQCVSLAAESGRRVMVGSS